jgi:Rieske Fe-S protein
MVFSPDMNSTDAEMQAGRRGILAVAVWSILGAIGTALASILGLAGIAPLRDQPGSQWLDAGPAESLSSQPQRLPVTFQQRQGWSEEPRTVVYYVFADPQGTPVAFSSQCPHLGCSVRWTGEASQFECPCHGGRFDQNGAVLAGPPSAPLTRPRIKIENSRILIERS